MVFPALPTPALEKEEEKEEGVDHLPVPEIPAFGWGEWRGEAAGPSPAAWGEGVEYLQHRKSDIWVCKPSGFWYNHCRFGSRQQR